MSGIRQKSFAFLASAAAILSPVASHADGAANQKLHALYAFKDDVNGPMAFDPAGGIYVPIETGKGLYIIDLQPNGKKWFLSNQSVLIHGGESFRNYVTDIKNDTNGNLVGISCDQGGDDSAFKLTNNLQTLQTLATWPNATRQLEQPACGTNTVALISKNRIGLSTDYDDGSRGVISEWMLTQNQGKWQGPKTVYQSQGYSYVPFPYVINKSYLLGYNYYGVHGTGAIQSLTRDTKGHWQRSNLFALPKDDVYGHWVNSFAYANGTMVAASNEDNTKNHSGYTFQLRPNGSGKLNPVMIDQNPGEGSTIALSPNGQNLCRISTIKMQYGTLDCFVFQNGAFQKTLSEVTQAKNEIYQGILVNDSNQAFVLSCPSSRSYLVLKGAKIPHGPQ